MSFPDEIRRRMIGDDEEEEKKSLLKTFMTTKIVDGINRQSDEWITWPSNFGEYF